MEDALELEKGLKPRGLCGLSNLGNTCYMNAALQALSNCPPLTQYFLECGSFAKETKNSSVSRNFSILVNEIWSRKRPKYVVPSQLLRSVRQINSQFRGYGQQDAQEFLRCIMDQLHEEIRQPVLSLTTDPESSDSDDEEPNHQNKRLLGGTSLSHTENLQDDDGDVDMYSESGDDAMDAKPLHVNTAEEQTDQDKETDGASKSKRRKTSTDPVDDNEVKLSVEGEPMSDDETEHHDQVDENMDNEDVALIKEEKPMDSDTMEHTRQPSDQERTKREQIAEKRKKRMKVPLNYSSIVTDLFDGTIQSSVQCLTCHRVSSRAETFQDVSLPIPGKDELTVLHASQCTPLASCSSVMDRDQDKSWMSTILEWLRSWFLGPQVTLSDCLSAFFSADELKGDNMYSCEKCKKLRNGVKLCKVMRLPEVLCIHLKRFKHEMYFSSKINHFISFPLTGLDMKPFLVKDFHKQDPTQKCTTYDLVAIITHHGNVGAGHYVTFAKNYINGKWYEFNDSWVSEVSDSFVADVEAYVLFYRKSSDEATRERQTFFNLLKDAQTHESRYFVSKKWLTKFQSCMEPGPITNSDFLCRHGAVHPLKFEKIHEITVPLPQSVWVHLLNRFGGGPPATTLNICRHCKRALDELERRRQREMETFKRLNHDYPANENVDVYFISLRWFKLWEVFVKGQEDDPPGPIDNSNIIVLKGNTKVLRASSEYGQLSRETWTFLHDIYDGGPVFFYEEEKDNEEEKQDPRDEEEDIQQE
ncbi:ubiquitin carboxyl-terminal hydrolase 20-like [Stylophora pistillata]|uniref:ubiquitin carboxyl-terminal hydrolase 20-like n=1 Tax=Stylophora pistillata TaxID=50429 RepID=UPI000C046BAB|nr:ubiquitin carboxyl-terminal hydrolase 20-like [Stylophora pistillata]